MPARSPGLSHKGAQLALAFFKFPGRVLTVYYLPYTVPLSGFVLLLRVSFAVEADADRANIAAKRYGGKPASLLDSPYMMVRPVFHVSETP